MQREIPRQCQWQAHRRLADLSLQRLRKLLEFHHPGTTKPPRYRAGAAGRLESNDPALARRYAFDAAPLRNRAGRVEESPDVTVRKEPLDREPGHANALALELRLEGTTPLRLDRLLAGELGLSRSRLQALDDRRRLTMEPDGAKALRKPVRDGLAVRIGLADEADCRAILSAACR
ncbi:DUF1062 domain-containing protein [Mesorhizobium sp. M2A.F.Ca.ET.029.05.1.1]|uniref:DUF1062 domain-containing protein n=1 Tax=Mesorhizobium sp. M2A.F.Ca.ET.029.05.1.1 TaxID=2496658 RepID=UPI0032AEF538